MKRLGALLYLAIFCGAFGIGMVLNKEAEYPCKVEPYLIRETTETKLKTVEKGGIVNINTATAEELTALEGVGGKLAERIVKYRDEHGRFEVKEDILKVPGIGEKKFEKMRESIVVE